MEAHTTIRGIGEPPVGLGAIQAGDKAGVIGLGLIALALYGVWKLLSAVPPRDVRARDDFRRAHPGLAPFAMRK